MGGKEIHVGKKEKSEATGRVGLGIGMKPSFCSAVCFRLKNAAAFLEAVLTGVSTFA